MRALVVVILWLGWTAPVSADVREEARREFNAGQAADGRKDWQTAIEHYLRANDLVPHPFAQFNIATDYERLGKLREAAGWFERYLQGSEDPADRERVTRTLRELAARPASITVRSTPSGARVRIDNAQVGATPFSGTVKGGFHRVSVELDGEHSDRDVTVEYGEPVNLDIAMRGATGSLSIRGLPYGALVTVDDIPSGTMPARIEIAPGPHHVQVTQQGYTPFDSTVEVVANREATVDVKLVRATGVYDGGDPGKPPVRLSYLLGVGGGPDLRGNGALLLFEAGLRVLQYDASIRLGKADGLTAIDFMVRAALTKGRIAPFIGAGYLTAVDNGPTDAGSSSSTGSGYLLVGGLRIDISQGDRIGFSILAETGVRYVSTTSSSATTTIVPLMAAFQIVYR